MGTVSDAELTSYSHRNSPFAQRVTVALAEKGIPNNRILVDFSSKPKGLLEANPIYGKVPTIVHRGGAVVESLIILEYLEDAFPETNPLMPKSALEKSEVRFWADYIYKGFGAVFSPFTLKAGGSPEKEANNEENVKFLITLNEAMASYSSEGPFFTGAKFGYLDVVLSPLTCCLVDGVLIPGPERLPRLHQWMEAVMVHPSVKSSLPTWEENFIFFKALLKKKAAAKAAAAAK